MPLEITGRNLAVTDAIRSYVTDKTARLREEFVGIEHVRVVLAVEKFRHIAEAVIQARGHVRFEVSEVSDDMYVSVDATFEKIQRKLRRLREKRSDHKGGAHRTRLSDIEPQPPEGG